MVSDVRQRGALADLSHPKLTSLYPSESEVTIESAGPGESRPPERRVGGVQRDSSNWVARPSQEELDREVLCA